ncbi:hypothetical protein CWI37_0340p0010, partial [Hamiltosporidium tvaerminnensis]
QKVLHKFKYMDCKTLQRVLLFPLNHRRLNLQTSATTICLYGIEEIYIFNPGRRR